VRFRSYYLTEMEQTFPLLCHYIGAQISALAVSGLREFAAVPFRITAVS
jgi:hypothetical protein